MCRYQRIVKSPTLSINHPSMPLERGLNFSQWKVGGHWQINLIRTAHDTAHLGRNKVLSQLNEKYYCTSCNYSML